MEAAAEAFSAAAREKGFGDGPQHPGELQCYWCASSLTCKEAFGDGLQHLCQQSLLICLGWDWMAPT